MSFIDRIRDLFRGKQSGADYGASTGGAVGATADDDKGTVGSESGSGSFGGGESSGGDGSGGGDGGGGSS